MSETPKKRSKAKIIVPTILVLVIAIGSYFFIRAQKFESTDNAQIDGDILSVRSSVTAYVASIRFEDNQTVHVGDTLIVFETTELEARVAQAQAALENAKAALAAAANRANAGMDNVQASIMNAEATDQSLLAARANLDKAQLAYDRILHLIDVNAATQEQKENAWATLQVAKAEVQRWTDQQKASRSSSSGLSALSRADQDAIQLSAATIKQREAELALAMEQLSHAYVVSPFNGVVTKRSVQQGQFVAAGQALCTVVNLEGLWVTANFKETQLQHLREGQEVEIDIDALPGQHFHGRVLSFAGATGARFSLIPPDNATGNFIKVTQRFPVRIALIKDSGQENVAIYPGLSAFVTVSVK